MRRWVIGDVRGDLSLLKKMIDKLGPTESDLVLFLGSCLGPGSNSKGVIDYILELDKKLPDHFRCLRGCYEYVFQLVVGEKCDWSTAKLWGDMGGKQVFRSYASDKEVLVMRPGVLSPSVFPDKVKVPLQIPASHIAFMQNLPLWYEDDIFPYIATHCGGHPGLFGGKLEHEEQTVFAENDWWKEPWKVIPGKTVLFSHCPFKQPFRSPGKIGIDLGAGLSSHGKLCAFEMMAEDFTIVG